MINSFRWQKIYNISSFIFFIVSIIFFFFDKELVVNVFNLTFSYGRTSLIILSLANFALFVMSLFLNKKTKIASNKFYIIQMLTLMVLNFIIVSNSVFVMLFGLFFIFLLNYLMNNNKLTLIIDCTILFISFLLLSSGLLRYFALSNMPLDFINIASNCYKMNTDIVNITFMAFFILIIRLFSFIPFNIQSKNAADIGINSIVYFVLGFDLLIKIYNSLGELIFYNHKIILIYLLINVLYYALMQFKPKSIAHFVKYTLLFNSAIAVICLFLCGENGFISFLYYSLSIVVTYASAFVLVGIFDEKMQGSVFSCLKKINDENKLLKVFVFVVFLNLAKLPPFVGFFVFVYSFINIFLIDSAHLSVIFMPYVLFACIFCVSVNSLNMLYKIFIQPIKYAKSYKFSIVKKTVLYVLIFAVLLSGIGMQYIINYFMEI